VQLLILLVCMINPAAHQVCLCCLLQCQQRFFPEHEITLEALAHLAHQPLERGLAQQQLS
jgi:hypothetical protein